MENYQYRRNARNRRTKAIVLTLAVNAAIFSGVFYLTTSQPENAEPKQEQPYSETKKDVATLERP